MNKFFGPTTSTTRADMRTYRAAYGQPKMSNVFDNSWEPNVSVSHSFAVFHSVSRCFTLFHAVAHCFTQFDSVLQCFTV